MSARRASVRIAPRLVGLAVGVAVLGGCLWEPKVEDQWTRVDLESASVVPYQALPTGTPVTFTGRANVTYRAILTGAMVAELRASSSLTSAAMALHPDADREVMAAAIDRIMQSSVSLGRDTRLVTGWDHLIVPFDFSFSASVPAVLDSAGAPIGLFLICYLGSADEIELPGGGDSLVVTPYVSTQYQVLPVGMTFTAGP
ncbi:MAG TPA: hypothetical protein VJY35_14955 [Candidatus Eisenbacteria bacterium]|nr:hypothetical protein [Candidatus Eisenbacteria bacterium]